LPKPNYMLFRFTMKNLPTAVILSLVAALQGQAQDKVDTTKNYGLTEVVITATRSATDRNKVPQKIELITKKDIEQTSAQEFTDLLKKNASVDIVQYPSLLSGVGIRGFRPQTGSLNQRTLLLVDGRPAGTTNLATLDMSSVERVEVLKGPASALYGSQAVGGVINVITKKSTGKIKANVFAEYGSFQTLRAGGSVGGTIIKGLNFDASLGYFRRFDNFKLGKDNLFRNALGNGSYIKYLPNGTEQEVDDRRADGDRREFSKLGYYSGTLRLGYQISEKWSVHLRGERFKAKDVQAPSDVFYGNAQPNSKDTDRWNSELSVNGDLGSHQLSFKAFIAEEKSQNYNIQSGGKWIVPFLSFQGENTWRGIQIRDAIQWKKHHLTVGVDYNEAVDISHSFLNTGKEVAPFSPNSALASTAIYAQGQLSFFKDKLLINPGLRYDFINFIVKQTPLLDSYSAGQKTNPFLSPSLGIKYRITEALAVRGTVGRAFVTPNAYNVAGYSESGTGSGKVSIIQGNANLTNENSVSWDAGISFNQKKSGISADVTYFATYVKDRITTQTTNPTPIERTAKGDTIKARSTYINANKGEIRGLEAVFGYDFGALNDYRYSLRVFASATSIIKAKEITVNQATGAETEKDIANVAKFNTSYGIEYDNLKSLRLRLSGRYVGRRKDTDFNDVGFPAINYASFMVLDFVASYTVAQKHTIGLFVNNLTDENYYEKRGYNMPGRSVSLRYGFNF
ncbi:MAG: TonB-dependent receptor, partial [Bacteroidota bacterium]